MIILAIAVLVPLAAGMLLGLTLGVAQVFFGRPS